MTDSILQLLIIEMTGVILVACGREKSWNIVGYALWFLGIGGYLISNSHIEAL